MRRSLNENELSRIVLDAGFNIHSSLGPGLFESVYENILAEELGACGLYVQKQVALPVFWNGKKIEHGFRADLIINSKVIIEIKSVEAVAPIHKAQVLTYLKVSGLKLGLLLNFNTYLLKEGIYRIVNGL